ncbi:MAG: diguanylate cyclase, partial [Ruminococcus sp.]|nr:diguanylate cyclase [Ruminococcus sp.]
MDKNSLNRLDSMFETFSIIAEGSYIYLCDMKNDYSRWSKSAVDYFNLPDRYMKNAGAIWEECIHPDDRELYRKSIDNIFSGKDKGHDIQYRAKAYDGSYVVCTCRGAVIRDENGNPEYFAGAIKNHGSLSYIDTITGLRSLYGFFDDVKTILWKKKKNSVIITGITGFSVINDMYGYKFGNKVLRTFANCIQEVFANQGSVYRMDGTKFAIISNSRDENHITELYKKLRKKVSHEFFVDTEKISLSINAGLMVLNDFNIESETIYSCLKYIYYESKNRRLGDIVIFDNIEKGND